jgi:DNA polymerase III alpha subunit
VFPETYKKVASRLADDVLVLVKAKAEPAEEAKTRLLVTDVMPLEQAKLAEARFVTIRVPLALWDREKGERLREILDGHRGECPVTLQLDRPGSFAVAVAPSAYFRVRPDPQFQQQVEALLGPASLVLSRTPA